MKAYYKSHSLVPIVLILFFTTIIPSTVGASDFDRIKSKTSANTSISFPDDLLHEGSSIFAFVLSDSREGGETQQETLLLWQKTLTEHPLYRSDVPIYHLPVIAGAPGFVKGFIRKGLGSVYQGIVDEEHVAVLFVKDGEKFASQAKLPFNEGAVITVVNSKGEIKGFVHGDVTPLKVEKIISLL